MKHIFAGITLATVIGCSQTPPVLTTGEGFRDPTARIASQTDVTAQRMAGSWVVRQQFGAANGLSGLSLAALPNGALQASFSGRSCEQVVCAGGETLVLLEPTGPGRWMPVGNQNFLPRAELWVMWMDFDSRTAAIGTPSGQFGWIIDRSTTGGDDRMIAAREIMDWFGYNTARLHLVAR